MPAWELLTGRVTAPGATLTAVTVNTGNSLTIRNTTDEADIRLVQAWGKHQTAGIIRIRSPRLHDNVQGIRLFDVVSEAAPLLPYYPNQRLHAQDTLSVELTGSATAGDIELAALYVWYSELPGIMGRFMTPEMVRERFMHLVTVENTLTLGTTGDYTGEEAINAEFDLLKANTDYALLGYHVSAECLAVRWRGVDFGNLGVGAPGNELRKELTANWFTVLSDMTGFPAIPVFNSANKAGLLLDGVQDENGVDTTVTSILAELRMG